MPIAVRDAAPGDAPGLGRVHVRAWQVGYRGGLMPDDYLDGLSIDDRTAMWERALAQEPRPRSTRLVAVEDSGDGPGRLLGFVVAGPAGGDDDAVEGEVYALNVDPESWGRGAGRSLLSAGTAHLRAAGFPEAVLWVHPDNTRAIGLYTSAGWEPDGGRRDEVVIDVAVPEIRLRRSLTDQG